MADRGIELGDGLNERQRAAVEFDDGPFAVLAGPGTGKTRVIAHRVERIIKGGARPDRIVALTFTVKAAQQLRERLAERVGGAAADAVNAHTFHGFGLRIIRRFRDVLGLPPELKLIDGPRVRRLLHDLIVEHGLYRELAAQGVQSAIAAAAQTIHALANNGTFPEEAAAFSAAWKIRLDRNGLNLAATELEADRARQAAFTRDAELYGLFARACTGRGWVTFDDLILHPVRLLRTSEMAAAMCLDDYRHFVVDEFQDVNAGQIELLRLLCPPERNPDLCVVGDDDQSIYEFRGADDRALAKFESIWGLKADARLPLSENYRSEAPIVGIANAIMGVAEDRFAPEKIVELPREKRGKAPKAGACVEAITLQNDGELGPTIAAMILADQAEGKQAWTRYAVIARGHLDLDRIGTALAMEGIPVRRSRGESAADDPGVQDVLRWIELLVLKPEDPGALFAARWLLTRPPLSAPSGVVSEWARAFVGERSLAKLSARGAAPGFVPWLVEQHGTDESHGAAIVRLAGLREELLRAAAHMRADAAVFEIIAKADIAHAEMLPGRERAARVSRLADLLRFVRLHADALDAPRDLAAFWAYYQELTEEEREFRGEAEDRVDGAGENGDGDEQLDAVLLTTAHKAKGLEFDTVFVAKVRPRGFPGSKQGEEYDLPEGLVDRAGDTRSREARRAAEERRVFYVACTRAERRLVLLAKHKKARGKPVDYFEELTLDPPGNSIVVNRTGAEVIGVAAAAGVKLAAMGPVLESPTGRLSGQEVLEHARRGARQLAAQALDVADRADATPQIIDQAQQALRDAAERIAVIAAVRGTGAAPAWARGALAEYGARLAQAAAKGADDPASAIFTPMPGPLKLSYTMIQEFERCPRCCYVRRVLGFPEAEGARQIVGQVVHGVLANFYERVREEESGGRKRPGLDLVLELGRTAFLERAADLGPGGEQQLAQVLAQLRIWHEKLYDPRHEVEQIEHEFRFAYPHTVTIGEGPARTMSHAFQAKIDRLDRLPGPAAGHRIVDYKTGEAWKGLLKPEADDLQMAVYAMAVSRHQEGAPQSNADGPSDQPKEATLLKPAVGTAEYWVLSTGQRGSIDLSTINYKKVKARIDKAISAMLRGEFEKGEKCWGLCEIVA